MSTSSLFETDRVRLWPSGDVLALEFKEAMPRIAMAILDAIERGLEIAGKTAGALIIYPALGHFALGADLDEGFIAAEAGNVEPLDGMLRRYQDVMLAVRHAPIPVVAAVRGAAVSGGCELLMHCHRVVGHRRSHIGLSEAQVGVLPSGGGLKEFALRASRTGGDIAAAVVRDFATVARARAGNLDRAKALGYLQSTDVMTDDADILGVAMREAAELMRRFTPLTARNPSIESAGREVLKIIVDDQQRARDSGTISAHQCIVNLHIAEVMCGGTGASAILDEAAYLAAERRHFLELAQLPKTQERLRHLRQTGQVLKN